ncbi:serine/threonine dehydratase [Halalkalibacillus sediminis]|uniref:threonine ammonia-lyase n=1 Tax=Halalkalibacillus sediminis TaxID=2018042 RepID=A0A2I0QS48_9BACI|nr:threonine/serine dehydratase [Halalkalibacillus sediminis]PKR77138.1 serine/threonine dehydratase [Halalkalibacillus sediminis]
MINLKEIQEAKKRIKDTIHETPILQSEQLSEQIGAQIFLKSEHLQKTGSFKIRGATNRVKQAVDEGAKFITAASSGNHGQAVAYISNQLGIPATIVVPEDATKSKVRAIEQYNGTVEYCGTTSAERIPRAKELAEQHGGIFVPPYDHPHIMAGQGTVGLEILEQVKGVEVIYIPIGGGGLSSGILTAVKETNPDIKVIGVEPSIANDVYLSLKNGEITPVNGTENSIADGLRTTQPGDMTFPILQKYLDDIVLVEEEEIKWAMSFVLERMKQMIEPSSATAVAAAIKERDQIQGKKVVCVISGGNVDIATISDLLVDTKR